MILLLALALVLLQITGVWLRYLPFAKTVLDEQRRKLQLLVAGWGIVAFLLYAAVLTVYDGDVLRFKLLVAFGWIPFFLIAYYCIPRGFVQHLFVLGMHSLFSLLMHTISGFIVGMTLPADYGELMHMLVLISCYLVLFLLLIPLERRLFSRLVPTQRFFQYRPLGLYIALMPLIVLFAYALPMLDGQLYHSIPERVGRLALPIFFFLMFRLVLMAGHQMSEHTAEVNRNNLLAQQLYSLREYTRLTEEKRQALRIIRHDLRHYNRLLGTLLDSGRIEEARQLIDKQEAELEHTALQEFCANDLINATLSIYVYHLGNLEIPLQQKINLPRDMIGMDTDVAILLSNLLENALHASMQQPVTDRAVKVTAQYDAGQFVLSVANRFAQPLLLDSDGWPYSEDPGHGTGMMSLRSFIHKYKAQCDFRQQDGWVTVMLYWQGEA
ncbi:GHKL domain-containing protein [Selenomonas sp. GACV-9]|nr:GHKL domain-containing protein [Selenomonas ruminantium]